MSFSKNKWFKILFVRKLWFIFPILIVFLVMAAYLGQLLPKTMANLFDVYANPEAFRGELYTLGLIFIGEYINRVCYQLSVNKYVQNMIGQVRSYCYENWLVSAEIQKSETAKKEYPLGEILSRIMNDSESIVELVTSGTFGVIIDSFFIGSCLVSFYTLDPFSGGALIGAELFAIFVLVYTSKYLARAFFRVRKEQGLLSRTVANVTAGISQNFYQENYSYGSKKVNKSFASFLKEQLKANIFDAGYYSVAESLYPLLLAFIGIVFSYSPLIKGAIVVAIIDLIQRSIDPIKDFSGKISNVQRAYSGIMRINEFTNYLIEGHQIDPHRKREEIDFQNLYVRVDEFHYPKRDDSSESFKLENIEFEASKGELIGIVGLSGSGKSTLLKILSCELVAKEGEINVNGLNKELNFDFSNLESMESYREQISLVSQESHVFTESLQFNITMSSKPSGTFNEFWKRILQEIPYLQAWGVHPDTEISPKELSMGQKQLVSALRACYLRKSIVLFDEISSGLDSELELALRKLLLLVQEHALTIIVAHRLETIINSHQIIVMDQGLLTHKGNHQDLLKNSDVYQEFISHL